MSDNNVEVLKSFRLQLKFN